MNDFNAGQEARMDAHGGALDLPASPPLIASCVVHLSPFVLTEAGRQAGGKGGNRILLFAYLFLTLLTVACRVYCCC